ncbi:MAG TPA: protein translocase subunit SecDF, partial [Chitinophagaceae bacterium]
MQLKGLVRFFALALILICLYQLSFTWIVRNYESSMSDKADLWVKAVYPTAEKKYPGDKTMQETYNDSLQEFKKQRLQRLLDSTKDSKIGPFSLTTYRNAKDKELALGLDLQGGMSVTMEIGLDGLIKSLANYTKDPVFNKALDAAVRKKATSGADLISLFTTEFENTSAGAKLAPYFVTRSNGTIKYDASNAAVATYLRDQASSAFTNTTHILTTRIDRFGVASPNINPDPKKGIINIELAGINDPERVRHYLQSTANLQFFEVYNINDVYEGIVSSEKSLSDYLKGTSSTDSTKTIAADTTKKSTDTANKAIAKVDTNAIGSFAGAQNASPKTGAATAKGRVDSNDLRRKEAPLRSLIQFVQPRQDQTTGKMQYPAALGYVSTNDTGLLNQYLNLDIVKNKFPANLE